MDFRLTDEQKQIQKMVREFGESEIKPHLMSEHRQRAGARRRECGVRSITKLRSSRSQMAFEITRRRITAYRQRPC